MTRWIDVPLHAEFYWRGRPYVVSGSLDGEGAGMVVRRKDGDTIRGVSWEPGMVQIGLSRGLEKAADRALKAAARLQREQRSAWERGECDTET